MSRRLSNNPFHIQYQVVKILHKNVDEIIKSLNANSHSLTPFTVSMNSCNNLLKNLR